MQNDNTPHTRFHRILVGVDDSPDAQLAFRYAISQARQSDAHLFITSILEDDKVNVFQALNKDFVHGERSALAKHIEEYRQLALRAGVKEVDTIIDEGDPGETIVKQVIPATNADLLIIGSLSKTGVRKYFGSQAAYMSKYAPISVMTVR
ncbi:universal stress protein [Lentilactobacillus otakiensis]|uniref:UspA domain-containing protein n=1 Tax=Lentilactobacillus otakiensis DSM 19908 = JCM 15040 TaxID=1423780 RepID=S4NG48_9LACO|nr:universal stress protein [Lentilactobacillus otakiensis]KRL10375.1 UspA domain-containing protein [Lentilactobacillus otakiensis DSM 19908 = JCM 15040]MBZ3777043.1 universal stress protein [Lentilactobacillus otakiensis]MDV3518066.1 universal stress protein [Lentilactobacillus otakiensis]GAD16202.1 uspA domain-containing protein [Lentilactobacillus otakiensis DSM 19908 = JCM 15040]